MTESDATAATAPPAPNAFATVRLHPEHYIDGGWVRPADGGGPPIDVIHAGTEEVLARVVSGTAQDVDAAVAAARRAFPAWSALPAEARARHLHALADGIRANKDELANLIASEVGMPVTRAAGVQVALPASTFDQFAEMIGSYPFDEEVGHSLITREPIGVVGCITPWNFPLHQIIGKIAPALAAGCTVVIKPSEIAPLNAFVLARIVHESDLPPGVFNLISGTGPAVGEALAAHPDVDMVSFTGSTRAGRRVAEVAAATVKRVTQELGGKSANVILDDADLTRAVRTGVNNCFFNSGQTCSAWTRMLVPQSRRDEAVEIARATAERFALGDPLAPTTKLGPLVSAAQRERVRNYIRQGVEDGATLVTGGADAPEDLPHGFFVRPTVFADVTPSMTIAREEIFGPVLSILTYADEDEAVAIANDSIYGLSGAVWSGDEERALRVARRLRTGQVDINGARYNSSAPFGGYKQSGNGREFGTYGLEEYLEVKAIQRVVPQG
ncbi:MAG: aldehyde dehydrogenase family protein [Acidobacteriota bacterium]